MFDDDGRGYRAVANNALLILEVDLDDFGSQEAVVAALDQGSRNLEVVAIDQGSQNREV